MKNLLPSQSASNMVIVLVVSLFFISFSTFAQVGIGTTTPDASSVLDVSSTTQGLLAPRMSTTERNNISSPAEGLLVFDTDEDAFFYYDTTSGSWIELIASKETRDNFVLVKSEADFPAPSGGVITLDPNTYYEINGLITLSNSINLNNAYLSGLDANEDILFSSGTIFSGNTGGSIRNITIAGGGTAFNITGGNTLLLQNTIISGMADVGTISGVSLFFSNIVNYVSNASGITYSNMGNLLLSNQGWSANNSGTYETFTGSFALIQKVSGFSQVIGATAAIDVTGITTISGDAVMTNVVFSGGGNYINGNSPYAGYNFTTDWTVDCPGIPRESDEVSTADINFVANVGSGASTTFTGTGSSSRRKILGTTDSNSLFRFDKVGNNRVVYKGTKSRFFQINAALSFQSQSQTATTTYIFYIAKGSGSGSASVIAETKIYGRANNNNDILSIPIVGTVELDTDDYIEIWAERFSGNGDMLTVSLNVGID